MAKNIRLELTQKKNISDLTQKIIYSDSTRKIID